MRCHDTTSGPAKRKFCQPMHDIVPLVFLDCTYSCLFIDLAQIVQLSFVSQRKL